MNSRGQVNLIDMQRQASAEYKWIMVYQDHLTTFVQLRPTKTKRAAEIAHLLMDIFCIFGAPTVLQSDNGHEFANSVIEEMTSMWDGLKIFHGRPRHSQGPAERANDDVENMLSTWMESNSTTKWADGLSFVQVMKNKAYHRGIKCSPYKAMFDQPMRVGLESSNLPDDAIANLMSEEDLERVIASVSSATNGQELGESQSVDVQNDCMRELTEGENSRGALEERRSESVDGQNDRMRELTEGENSGGALEEQRQNALDIAGIEEAEGEEIQSTTGETVSPGEDTVEERVEEDSLRSGEGQWEEMRRETSDFNRSSAEIEGREEYFVTEWGDLT